MSRANFWGQVSGKITKKEALDWLQQTFSPSTKELRTWRVGSKSQHWETQPRSQLLGTFPSLSHQAPTNPANCINPKPTNDWLYRAWGKRVLNVNECLLSRAPIELQSACQILMLFENTLYAFYFLFLVPKVIASKYSNIDLDFAGVGMEGSQFTKTPGRWPDEKLSEIRLEPSRGPQERTRSFWKITSWTLVTLCKAGVGLIPACQAS